jgi:hypothetical protein
MLTAAQEEKLIRLARTLVDQERARVIVPPQEPASGFWFGGGNMIEGPDGHLYLVGRYRNRGDSRTGVAAGTRGLELALFRSTDRGGTFEKIARWEKGDLDVGEQTVLSIEGSALRWTDDGVELFVSTEKDHVGYPEPLEDFLKPGTGVWTIDRLRAGTIEELTHAPVEPFLSCRDPRYLHVKDPFLYEGTDGPTLLFCSHPYCWSSSNTGYVPADGSSPPVYEFFPRGTAWDVAMTRGTGILDVPRMGAFADQHVSLMFYDGGECVRDLDEHASAVKRSRGYSCEELGGLACFPDGTLGGMQRLSKFEPLFVSPHGTGCSRYVDVLSTRDGLYVTWQQSQPDRSQPLVMHFASADEVERLLA